jgi:hypothetical protein
MGRKSRFKRERVRADPADDAAPPASSASPPDVEPAPLDPERGAVRPPHRSRAVGARVARVAVDDDTWAAFRDLCGATPASIRLGELVAAEVERARNSSSEPDPAAAVRAIRSHVDELEAFVRGIALRRGAAVGTTN